MDNTLSPYFPTLCSPQAREVLGLQTSAVTQDPVLRKGLSTLRI